MFVFLISFTAPAETFWTVLISIDQQRSIRHPHERSSLNCILEEDDKEKHVHCDPIEKTNL